ncbi:nitronate monooxygenase [Frankia sp. CNm7]|uniref:Nitronate monooxygenase n=1 Tax=Frankia nepalensis TaxID=1836974 RepID=A0A937UQX8_9ACTN|nr:nitronate monooxygenase [Frankia nepalensis]MBL7502055.1 nitronate monooxygenase [Frankia nepalensis]MBL7511961.1 nitronate monooxygenase [Frankia nepalensis]MBL7524049.1 nitronate monooxygenase [Frankia nepalensis]MBL7630553.1 nitronate monooxygenase [Frankia nepalensis]
MSPTGSGPTSAAPAELGAAPPGPGPFDRLTVPLIAAPMTRVSTPALVSAACAAGIIGAFPTSNCRSSAELDEWLDEITASVRAASGRPDAPSPGPVAANLIVHRVNRRLDDDLATIVRRGVGIVITSVGNPVPVIDPLHQAGCRVLVDVASVAHAEKAAVAGADGLVLLSAGAGGHTGSANPFAFARAVRHFYPGPLVLAGGISDGTALWAATVLGYDLGYMGTKFIATEESGASPEWRQAVVDARLDDITLGTAPNGVAASLLPGFGSAGHTVSGVHAVTTVAEVVRATRAQWHEARARTHAAVVDLARAGGQTT